ncbi:MAG TPA: YceH family protein [Alphaproteobacteria bacterium]|nr:YceH family protein [Alphaproteobacteria bacterium]
MNIVLNAAEARVLGALVEKDITTPDYYPLSLNALINACNQKNNRELVTNFDEETVRLALRNLSDKHLAGTAGGADSRVTKYEHRLQEVFNFTRQETALICVLLLRGPQTPGELRGRTERMHRFEDLDEVLSGLQQLMRREPPLAKALGRRPGTKEIRYAHLLSGDVEAWEPPVETPSGSASADAERLIQLEEQVATLRSEVAELKQQMADFKKQFE